MLNFYHYLPDFVEPVIVSFGSFNIRWYSVMYLVGLFVVWKLLVWRIDRGEGAIRKEDLWKIVTVSFFGAIIGGRLGFFLFYDSGALHANPLLLFWPFSVVTGEWTGLAGMSFFGALLGAVFAGWIMAKRLKMDFVRLADFIVPAVPLGYMFGRIGNFLNGELFGVETTSALGMQVDGTLRHPTQLYEAFFEGLVLFLVLWFVRGRMRFRGEMLSLFCVGYAIIRLFMERFRVEDVTAWCAGIPCSMGEFLSGGLLLSGMGLYVWFQARKNGTL